MIKIGLIKVKPSGGHLGPRGSPPDVPEATQTPTLERARSFAVTSLIHSRVSALILQVKANLLVTGRTAHPGKTVSSPARAREISAVWENQSPGSSSETTNSQQTARTAKREKVCMKDVGRYQGRRVYWPEARAENYESWPLRRQFGSFPFIFTTPAQKSRQLLALIAVQFGALVYAPHKKS